MAQFSKNLPYVWSLAIFLYGPRFGPIDIGWVIALLYLFFVVVVSPNRRLSWPPELIFLFLVSCWFYAVPLFQGGEDLYQFYWYGRMVRAMTCYLAFYLFFLNSRKLDDLDFLKINWVVLFVHVLIAYLQTLDLGGSGRFFKSLNMNNSDEDYLFRSTGFSVGFDGAGVLVGVYCYLSAQLLLSKKSIFYMVCLICALPAFIITSRTGMTVAGFAGIYLFLLNRYISESRRLLVFTLLFVVVASLGVHKALSGNLIYDLAFDRTFETFINYGEKGEFRSGSTDDMLENHYILPSGWSIIYGDAPHSRSQTDPEKAVSDVGYVQLIFSGGIIGMVLVVWAHLIFVSKVVSSAYKSSISAFIVFMGIVLLFTSLKGPYFFSRQISDMFILALSFFYSKNFLLNGLGGGGK